MVAVFGVTFLTPFDAVFAVAAGVPLAALVVTERHSERVRRLLGLRGPGRRALASVAIALGLLPVLVAVAAAQPVVVHRQIVRERGDAEAFFVFDTSLSMSAAAAPGRPTRFERAKALALRLEHSLGGVPVGLASFTDRVLPVLMPTTDSALFERTLAQSVRIDEPPPSQSYGHRRATNLEALVNVLSGNFFSSTAKHRLLVIFTDGEASPNLQLYGIEMGQKLQPVFVHVWAANERIWHAGNPDPYYRPDPASAEILARAAGLSGGMALGESQFSRLLSFARQRLGSGPLTGEVSAYARVALAPWVVLAGVVPLGFLFWRRNL